MAQQFAFSNRGQMGHLSPARIMNPDPEKGELSWDSSPSQGTEATVYMTEPDRLGLGGNECLKPALHGTCRSSSPCFLGSSDVCGRREARVEPSQPHHSLSLGPETSRNGAPRAEMRLQEDSHPGKGDPQPLEGTEAASPADPQAICTGSPPALP